MKHEHALDARVAQSNMTMAEQGWNTACPPANDPDLAAIRGTLAATYEQLRGCVGSLHALADQLYGPGPLMGALATTKPEQPGEIAALRNEAGALSWIASQLDDAISRFSHLV